MDVLQQLPISPVLRAPHLDAALQVRPPSPEGQIPSLALPAVLLLMQPRAQWWLTPSCRPPVPFGRAVLSSSPSYSEGGGCYNPGARPGVWIRWTSRGPPGPTAQPVWVSEWHLAFRLLRCAPYHAQPVMCHSSLKTHNSKTTEIWTAPSQNLSF